MSKILFALLLGWLLLVAPAAEAQTTTTSTSSTSTTIIIGGGGGARTDCLLVLATVPNTPTNHPRHIRCTDGDPCDGDGTVNGVCQFPVMACGNSTFDPRCTVFGIDTDSMTSLPVITVDHAVDDGMDPKFDTEFQAMQNVVSGIDSDNDPPNDCTIPINFHVAIQGPFGNNVCRRDKKLLRITTESDFLSGYTYTDRDRLRMTCDPAPNGCSPMVIFDSALDRIQRQIFNQSCALSGCHDSETAAGGMLLEEGSAYLNVFNVTPANAAADAAGWKRIKVTGDPDLDVMESFLFRKVDHDLPSEAFGPNMPLNNPKLDQNLIDIIEAWIRGGAPSTGWPPGTDL